MPTTTFDPWAAANRGRASGQRKKLVRLAGNATGKVHTLVKTHDWRGKAVYIYHLVKVEMRRVDKPTDEEWAQYTTAGTPIPYPAEDHESSDAAFWVQYGKEQAARMGLQVAE